MKKYILPFMTLMAFAIMSTSCHDTKSYAELLTEESEVVNTFLAHHRVVEDIPEDDNFEIGLTAPYYRLDEDNNVYMQVLMKGSDERPEKDDRVYFRYTQYNLYNYIIGDDEYNASISVGNADNMNSASTFFLFDNYTVSESSQYGVGIQLPMHHLGYGAKVNLIIKSQAGPTTEMAYVIPYLFTITYNKPMI